MEECYRNMEIQGGKIYNKICISSPLRTGIPIYEGCCCGSHLNVVFEEYSLQMMMLFFWKEEYYIY